MDRKQYTFLVVSDRKGVAIRWVVSAAWVKLGLVMACLVLVFAAASVVDYVGLLVQSVENKKLKAENIQLRNQFKVVEGKLTSLEASVERVKSFSAKLKLITETEDEEKSLKLTMAPGSGDDAPMGFEGEPGRGPAGLGAGIVKEDAVFFQRPPLDLGEGEIASAGPKDYATLSVRIDRSIKDTNMREQNVLELLEILSNRQSLLRATPSVVPARGWFTSRFGYRINPTTGSAILHQGLDIAAAPGTPIHAPADGLVSFAGWDAGYGKLISIDHGYGVVTRYGHNSQLFVVVGQRVRRGDVIGSVGNSGRSTGPHLHYEVRLNDVPVDPLNYILVE